MRMAEAGCCGDVKSRVELVKRATEYIVQGHEALSRVYRTFAEEAEDPMEKLQYKKAALAQDELAIRSKEMTLPDEEADAIERRDTDPAPSAAVSK